MDARYTDIMNNTSSHTENFMRLYEEIAQFRTSPHMLTNNIIDRLTPEQLAQAKAAGILPIDERPKVPAGVQPIMPVTDSKPTTVDSNKVFDEEELKENGFYRQHWHDPTCNIQCTKADVTIPPLVIISLDGFAAEYLDRKLVNSLDSMADCGSRAEFMFPSYPSKTFPNHYSIATGLYPESHGIVDNTILDPTISNVLEDIKRTKYSEFFLGEPIWSAAVRQHRRMYCLFWPGCQYNITGFNPTLSLPYNKSLPYSGRVDMIVDWLLLPATERPSLIMAYFDQPDSVGHFHTNDHQVNLELSYMDSVLNYLYTSLYKNGLFDCTNLVILSDHGMQFLNKRYFVNEMVDTRGMAITAGVMGRIYMANSTNSLEWLEDKLECMDKENFRIFDRKKMPKRYHYAKTERVGDLLLDGHLGTTFYPSVIDDYHVTSDHGYDYITRPMHAIFFARGPNIKPKLRLAPFQNVELFNLFSELLRLNPDVPTNGTEGILDSVVYNMNLNKRPPSISLRPMPECAPLVLFQKRAVKGCLNTKNCQTEAQNVNKNLDECKTQIQPQSIFYTDQLNLCTINMCSIAIATSLSSKFGSPTMVFETLTQGPGSTATKAVPDANATQNCSLIDIRYDADCTNWTKTMAQERQKDVEWISLMANNPGSDLRDLNQLNFLVYKNFNKGPFSFLQNATRFYAKKYGKITSITGTIYDFNMDGLADDQKTFWDHQNSTKDHLELLPTHIFRILMRCEDGQWHINGISCKNSTATRIETFIIPNEAKDINCLAQDEYLLLNTARVKDVELLTNTQFFAEKMWFPEKESLFWRTNITTALWS
uniref:Extracellular Endonuclease subunit A domain-containing protein n=1 Tax=Ditylenchus dipsaci TaxID=166011 RepID=A0A915DIR1_9BILA